MGMLMGVLGSWVDSAVYGNLYCDDGADGGEDVPRGVSNLYEWAWLAREWEWMEKDGALPCWNLGDSLEGVDWSGVAWWARAQEAWVCWAWAWA
jgi:hypothetical protein